MTSTSTASPTGNTRSLASNSFALRRPTATRTSAARRRETMEHRAGWDGMFSAPKSVSLTALVGGDDRVREAHRASVAVALSETEQYTQARMGGNRGQLRPLGKMGCRDLRARQREAGRRLRGSPTPYAFVSSSTLPKPRAGRHGRCNRASCTGASNMRRPCTARSSPSASGPWATRSSAERVVSPKSGATRRHIWTRRAGADNRSRTTSRRTGGGAGAAQIAAHQTREAKVEHAREAMQRRHRDMATAFGEQPARAVRAAQTRGPRE